MRKVNLSEIEERERRSPKGRFHAYFKEVSVALGAEPNSTDQRKRHPFDLSLFRIPPGASRCPYHTHSVESELYLVLSGRVQVRDNGGIAEATAGDAFFFAPGEPHQLTNPGPDELTYYVISDNSLGECCHYPDSDKWMVSDGVKNSVIKGAVVEYYSGEE